MNEVQSWCREILGWNSKKINPMIGSLKCHISCLGNRQKSCFFGEFALAYRWQLSARFHMSRLHWFDWYRPLLRLSHCHHHDNCSANMITWRREKKETFRILEHRNCYWFPNTTLSKCRRKERIKTSNLLLASSILLTLIIRIIYRCISEFYLFSGVRL